MYGGKAKVDKDVMDIDMKINPLACNMHPDTP